MKAASAAALVGSLVVGMIGLGVILSEDAEPSELDCAPATGAVQIDLEQLPTIDGWDADQVRNAALIIDAGNTLGIAAHGQQIAVMTAIGESTLRVLDHGDSAGPDSRGLFQQRDNGAWGSYEDRMDPRTSATNFYKALLRVEGWESLAPTIAAHRVQRNADPYHYERFWEPAGELLVRLAGFDVGDDVCDTAPGGISADGWTHPFPDVNGLTGRFGDVRHGYTHQGDDFPASTGTPIYAAAAGIVVRAACEGYQGRSPCNIVLDHGPDPNTGKRIETWYVHMFADGVLVTIGQEVSVGQQIARVGNNGNSTGAHLHLEVHEDGAPVSPVEFFAALGIDLTSKPTAPPLLPAAGAAVTWARTQIGLPYRLGAVGPNAYDCSGLTLRAYAQNGATLPRTSRDQYDATTRISRAELQPGDLVFWSNDATPAGIYHVAIYTGQDRIIQAPSPGRTVEEVPLWTTNLYAYGRVR